MKVLVIGGGIAGMLASRVLSDVCDTVTIVDRDDLNGTATRPGVPQQHHIHTLLARGRELIEVFYPGISEELNELGVPTYTWTQDILMVLANGYAPRGDTGVRSLGASRHMLEAHIRQRTRQIANIKWISHQEVAGFICHNGAITGVRTLKRKTREASTIYADLVVDASGSRSNTPMWLSDIGYDEPRVTQINPFLGYASRWYRIPEDMTLDVSSVVIQPRANEQFYRGAAAMRTEDNHIVITLVGVNKDYPPTDEAAFAAFARSLPDQKVYQWIQMFEPISGISGYRCLSQIRHYERLERFPDKLLVIGDAFCFFNPIYGQGMTIAAMEAELLQRMLHKPNALTNGFGERFHRRLARLIAVPWMLTTGEDMRYPLTEGARISPIQRLMHRYTDFFINASVQELELGLAFIRVMHMVAHPASLAHPRVLFYVLRATLRRAYAKSVHSINM